MTSDNHPFISESLRGRLVNSEDQRWQRSAVAGIGSAGVVAVESLGFFEGRSVLGGRSLTGTWSATPSGLSALILTDEDLLFLLTLVTLPSTSSSF